MTSAQPVYYASVEGSRFEFSAVGTTPGQAVEAVMSAWRAHVKQTGADPDYIERDDVQILVMIPGQGYRDHDHALGRRVTGVPKADLTEWQQRQAQVRS